MRPFLNKAAKTELFEPEIRLSSEAREGSGEEGGTENAFEEAPLSERAVEEASMSFSGIIMFQGSGAATIVAGHSTPLPVFPSTANWNADGSTSSVVLLGLAALLLEAARRLPKL